MKLDWRDERWSNIYRHYVNTHYGRVTKKEMEQHLLKEGIKVIKDPGDGRWEGVEIEDEEQLAWLLLKYGGSDEADRGL